MFSNNNQNVSVKNLLEANEAPTVITQRNIHPIRSEKYSVVTTGDIILQLEESDGITWTKVAEEKNSPKYKGFGTHLIRCSHPDFSLGSNELDQELKPSFYIRNNYTGRFYFEMRVGLFRGACLNGLYFGNQFKAVRMKHIGLSKDQIRSEVAKLSQLFKTDIAKTIIEMKETKIGFEKQLQFAEAALRERVKSNANFVRVLNVEDLLRCHRDEDKGDSIWEVYQRVQENIGLNFRTSPVEINYEYLAKKDDQNIIKQRKISKLTNIAEVERLNSNLFDLALALR